MRTIVSDRLILVPATEEILTAEAAEDRELLGFLLGAQIPYNWPPDMFKGAIPLFLKELHERPERLGWLAWYWLRKEPMPEKPTLIGDGGFKGEPDASGTVEIGYSILPQFEKRGYATEGSKGLIEFACSHPAVRRVVAQVDPQNIGSVRVLEKLNFALTAEGKDSLQIYERKS